MTGWGAWRAAIVCALAALSFAIAAPAGATITFAAGEEFYEAQATAPGRSPDVYFTDRRYLAPYSQPAFWRLLKRHKTTLAVHLRYKRDFGPVPAGHQRHDDVWPILKGARRHGVPIQAWIVVPYADGYWAHDGDLAQVRQAVDDYFAWAKRRHVHATGIQLDLETSIQDLHTLGNLRSDPGVRRPDAAPQRRPGRPVRRGERLRGPGQVDPRARHRGRRQRGSVRARRPGRRQRRAAGRSEHAAVQPRRVRHRRLHDDAHRPQGPDRRRSRAERARVLRAVDRALLPARRPARPRRRRRTAVRQPEDADRRRPRRGDRQPPAGRDVLARGDLARLRPGRAPPRPRRRRAPAAGGARDRRERAVRARGASARWTDSSAPARR